jgi:hypothetical protein
MARNRFGQSGAFHCEICHALTRDTGHGEASLALCKRCLFEAYVENAQNDYGTDSPEYRKALANLTALGPKSPTAKKGV